MAKPKRSRKERMAKYLPLHHNDGRGRVITGHICDDWMLTDKNLWPYSACCQDPHNWEGRGDFKEIKGDPWMVYGYVAARGCWCSVCGVSVIGHEYTKEPSYIVKD